MQYTVYILKSCCKDVYYIGCTSDIKQRINEHNSGRTRSTKPYKPWKLIYQEQYSSKNDAYKREWHLKHPRGYLEKKKIIEKYGEVA